MGKKLSEMTLEELWQLFPIFLTEHQPCWDVWYEEEKAFLQKLLPETAQITHIGSTSVPTIWAKPIVDILIEFLPDTELTGIRDTLTANGYRCMSQEEGRVSLNKGYTEQGFAERVFHIHLRYAGDNDEVFFCAFLRTHPQIAGAYEAMKLRLWKEFEHDRDGYTGAKTDFIRKYTRHAKLLAALTDKDDRIAYAAAQEILSASETSDEFSPYLDEFAARLKDRSSFVRTRAFLLCCGLSKWDRESRIREILPQMLALLQDPKPTVVRQCLSALPGVSAAQPELRSRIRREVESIDLSGYRDSMIPLLQKDIQMFLESTK